MRLRFYTRYSSSQPAAQFKPTLVLNSLRPYADFDYTFTRAPYYSPLDLDWVRGKLVLFRRAEQQSSALELEGRGVRGRGLA